MKLDVLGLFAACSYALDCVEAEFIHVTSKHARRVAYMSVCTAEQLGVQGKGCRIWLSSVIPKHLHLTPGKKQLLF